MEGAADGQSIRRQRILADTWKKLSADTGYRQKAVSAPVSMDTWGSMCHPGRGLSRCADAPLAKGVQERRPQLLQLEEWADKLAAGMLVAVRCPRA